MGGAWISLFFIAVIPAKAGTHSSGVSGNLAVSISPRFHDCSNGRFGGMGPGLRRDDPGKALPAASRHPLKASIIPSQTGSSSINPSQKP
jgi:hypothetical protein